MNPLEFVFWLYGAVELGDVSSLVVGSDVCDNVLAHVKLVIEDHGFKPEEYPIDKILEFEGKIKDRQLLSRSEIVVTLNELKSYYWSKFEVRKEIFLYYLQGAFETTDVEKIKLSEEAVKQGPAGLYKNELLFYFMITKNPFIEQEHLYNLKSRVRLRLAKAC